MAMLTLNGVLQNVYSQPERKDEKTGRFARLPCTLRSWLRT